ncbi:hypothetical protein DICVIV_02233 [Dictyocaulus viviparus]|uniref:Uncharacterized protein n=1 Tax=Dictyocaulus viviparus TaxID=29172 RepID=A0A0D8Y4F3_DICVI|nr:hypothetical protein DICVIV_02233 [Dictyocaulus viviparus]
MGLFDAKYLSNDQLNGFHSYKYSCVDNSPIAIYISHPFWNWLVTWYPRTWAPNVLTLLGWSFVMGCFLLESVLDYDLTANSVGSDHPVPNCTHNSLHRVQFSSLFQVDHGLDSWSIVPLTITVFSVFGTGELSVTPIHILSVLIGVQVVFIATHCEKYNTGVLFLSWGYDAGQYMLIFTYMFTYFVGYKCYKFYVYDSISFVVIVESSFYLCSLGSVVVSIYNMWHSYSVEKTFKQPSLYEATRPVIPCAILFITSLSWACLSSTDICSTDPRVYFFALGTVFSNIACRLIIAQMSNQRCDVSNKLLLLYMMTADVLQSKLSKKSVRDLI